MKQLGNSGLTFPDEALKRIVNKPEYYQVTKRKRERNFYYNEFELSYIGFMISGIEEGESIEAVQVRWDDLYKEINDPGYYEKDGPFDQWMRKHQTRRDKDLKAEFLEDLYKKSSGNTRENVEIILRRNYPEFLKCTLKSWAQVTHEHRTRFEKVQDLLDGKDRLQFWQGPPKRGKTHLLVGLFKEFSNRAKLGYIHEFSYIADLFSGRSTEDRNGEKHTPSTHIKNLSKYYVLLIDNFNPNKDHKAVHISERVFDLINERINKNLKTVFVGNKEMDIMLNFFGKDRDSVERRIMDYGKVIDFNSIKAWENG